MLSDSVMFPKAVIRSPRMTISLTITVRKIGTQGFSRVVLGSCASAGVGAALTRSQHLRVTREVTNKGHSMRTQAPCKDPLSQRGKTSLLITSLDLDHLRSRCARLCSRDAQAPTH